MPYFIIDWDKNFEIAESRRNKKNKWIPLPNKMDGLAYKRITQNPKRHEIFTCWILLIQLASKMPTRGILENELGVLDFDDMELITGFPAKTFQIAIEFLESPKIQWIGRSGHTQQNAGHTTTTVQYSTVQNSTVQNSTEQNNSVFLKKFDLFWEAYPARNGKKVGKKSAFEIFNKQNIEDLDRIIQNARNYGINNDFAKDPERFLKNEFWKDWDSPQTKGATNGQKSFREIDDDIYADGIRRNINEIADGERQLAEEQNRNIS